MRQIIKVGKTHQIIFTTNTTTPINEEIINTTPQILVMIKSASSGSRSFVDRNDLFHEDFGYLTNLIPKYIRRAKKTAMNIFASILIFPL
ncbi:hypothetical protein DQG23_04380 [Paenibacillus contaminans]|uniref:Uncharacterized protein n=1 Tax=Paenibacillus contaminans TaxID=450362 RepID=A0A329MQK7_9BACL|nr:hypothetical protein DQG23_04380 [Paenibacillus contaminans]